MKYILTESQFALLTEDIDIQRLKRRMSYESMVKFINNAELDFPTLCDDFSDEFEYADNVISRAIDDLLLEDEEIMNRLGDKYDEVNDLMVDHCKDLFGEELFDLYRDTCENYD